MTRVIQIRGVPDDVHRKLVEAAEAEGKSLTTYLNDELALIACRVDLVWHNREVILAGRREFGAPHLSSGEIAEAIEEGRREREEHLVPTRGRRRK